MYRLSPLIETVSRLRTASSSSATSMNLRAIRMQQAELIMTLQLRYVFTLCWFGLFALFAAPLFCGASI